MIRALEVLGFMRILDVNDDLLVHCASKLGARDLITFASCCRRLQNAAYDDSVWQMQCRLRWPPKTTPSGIFQFSGGREAFLSRIRASQQFRFTDPESWELPCPYMVVKHMLLDAGRVVAAHGSNVVLADGSESYLREHTGRITCLRLYSTDCADHYRSMLGGASNVVATCSADQTIRVWGKNSPLRTLRGHSGCVNVIADMLLPEGTLASGGMDCTVKLWSVFGAHRRRALLQATLHGHEFYVKELAVARHNPSILVSAAKDSKIRVWDAAAAACVGSSRGPGIPAALKCFESTCYIAGGKAVAAIDLRTMQTTSTFSGHEDVIQAMAVSASGSLLCTGGNDNCGLLWDVRKCEEPVAVLGNHEGPVSVVHIDDYKAITAGPKDCSAQVWDSRNGAWVSSLDHPSGVTALACQGTRVATAVHSDTSVLYYRDYSNCVNAIEREDESGPSKFWDLN